MFTSCLEISSSVLDSSQSCCRREALNQSEGKVIYIYICMYLYVSKIVHILYHFLYPLVFALARFLLMDTLFNCRSVSEGLRWLRPARRMPRSLRYKARDSQQWKVSCELSVSDFFWHRGTRSEPEQK